MTHAMAWGVASGHRTSPERISSPTRLRPEWFGLIVASGSHPGSPFGGVGESGYGLEMGFEVMREYTQPKSVWVNVDAKIPPFYPR